MNYDKYMLEQAANLGFKECPICFQFNMTTSVKTICGHQFCLYCILKFMNGKVTFKCPLCRTLCNKYNASLHIFKGHNVFSCERCDKKGMSLPGIEKHILKECKNSIVECKECSEPIPYSKLGEHIDKCKYDEVSCKFCDLIYIRNDVEEHRTKHCLSRMTQCDVCGKNATAKYFMTSHKNCELMVCEHCDKIFTTETSQSHLSVCEEKRIVCSYTFCAHECKLKDYVKHINECHFVVECKIDKCGEVFLNTVMFIKHIEEDHTDWTTPIVF